MTEFSLQTLRAFDAELEKTADKAELARRAVQLLKGQAGAAGAGIGAGGALGALAGGGLGGLRGYREARDAGATRGQSALYALQRGMGGAGKGALVGAATGGALGLAGGQKAQELAKGLVQRETLGAPARMAQRQLHSLTGYADREGLKAMRGPAETARRRLVAAGEGLAEADPSKSSWLQRAAGKLTGKAPKTQVDTAVKEVGRARAGLDAAVKAEEAGVTSVPGVLKGLVGRAELGGKQLSPLEAVKTMAGEQWHGSGLGGKALMLGLPAAGVASALRPSGPAETAEGGRLERAGKALGTGLAFATPMGLAGQAVLQKGLGGAAGLVGAGLDTTQRRKKLVRGELPPAQTGPEPDEEHSPNPERFMTASAMGRAPEGMGV